MQMFEKAEQEYGELKRKKVRAAGTGCPLAGRDAAGGNERRRCSKPRCGRPRPAPPPVLQDVVEGDKSRIEQTIGALDEKKREALEKTWRKVRDVGPAVHGGGGNTCAPCSAGGGRWLWP